MKKENKAKIINIHRKKLLAVGNSHASASTPFHQLSPKEFDEVMDRMLDGPTDLDSMTLDHLLMGQKLQSMLDMAEEKNVKDPTVLLSLARAKVEYQEMTKFLENHRQRLVGEKSQ